VADAARVLLVLVEAACFWWGAGGLVQPDARAKQQFWLTPRRTVLQAAGHTPHQLEVGGAR
jgi:hypothetical protein